MPTQYQQVEAYCEKQDKYFTLQQVYADIPHILQPNIRALLQQATPRTASAIAAEYTELMVLEQSDFQRIFHIQGRSMGFEKLAELLKISPGRRTGPGLGGGIASGLSEL